MRQNIERKFVLYCKESVTSPMKGTSVVNCLYLEEHCAEKRYQCRLVEMAVQKIIQMLVTGCDLSAVCAVDQSVHPS